VFQNIKDQERALYKKKLEARANKRKLENMRINPDTGILEYDHEQNPNSINYLNLQKHYAREQERQSHFTQWIGGSRTRKLVTTLEKNSWKSDSALMDHTEEGSHIYRAAKLMGTTFDETNRKKYTLEEAIALYSDTVVRKGVMHADKSLKYTYMMTTLADVVLSNRTILEQLSAYYVTQIDKNEDPEKIIQALNQKFSELQLATEVMGARNMHNFDASQVPSLMNDIMKNEAEQNYRLSELSQEIQLSMVKAKQEVEQILKAHLDPETQARYEEQRETPSVINSVLGPSPRELEEMGLSEQEESANETADEDEVLAAENSVEEEDSGNETESLEEGSGNESEIDLDDYETEVEYEPDNNIDWETVDREPQEYVVQVVEAFPVESLTPLQKLERILSKSTFKLESNNPLRDLKKWNQVFENMIAKSVRLLNRHRCIIYDLETCTKLLYICRNSRANEDLDHESLFKDMISISYHSERDRRLLKDPYVIKRGTPVNRASRQFVEEHTHTDPVRRRRTARN
jgi:hypothetical protein